MTLAELETKMKGIGAQMEAAVRQMRQKLESLPPQQRKQIEQMMGAKFTDKRSSGPLK